MYIDQHACGRRQRRGDPVWHFILWLWPVSLGGVGRELGLFGGVAEPNLLLCPAAALYLPQTFKRVVEDEFVITMAAVVRA